MTAVRLKLGLIAIALVGAQSATAEDQADCKAAAKALNRAATVLEDAAATREIGRMGMVRMLTGTGIAAAYAKDMNWPQDMAAALADLRDLPKPLADGSLVMGKTAFPRVVADVLIIAAGMPAQCPETEIPDFAAYKDMVGQMPAPKETE